MPNEYDDMQHGILSTFLEEELANRIMMAKTLEKIKLTLTSISDFLSESKKPKIIFDIRSTQINTNFLEIIIKNIGGSPAYDVEMKFEPDLDYIGNISLSQVPILKHLPFIEQGYEIKFPY